VDAAVLGHDERRFDDQLVQRAGAGLVPPDREFDQSVPGTITVPSTAWSAARGGCRESRPVSRTPSLSASVTAAPSSGVPRGHQSEPGGIGGGVPVSSQ